MSHYRCRSAEALAAQTGALVGDLIAMALRVPLTLTVASINRLPGETREHTRQAIKESILAARSLANATSAVLEAGVDAAFAGRPGSAGGASRTQRVKVEREDESVL